MLAEIEAEAAQRHEELGTEQTLAQAAVPCGEQGDARAGTASVSGLRRDVPPSLKMKFGKVTGAIFPKGSFPPSLPFARTGEELDPLADAGGSRSFALALAATA